MSVELFMPDVPKKRHRSGVGWLGKNDVTCGQTSALASHLTKNLNKVEELTYLLQTLGLDEALTVCQVSNRHT